MLDGKSIGLVLSGGGIRGMAHIGLIKAMEAQGIVAHRISGTSVGALVGGLYAKGSSVEEMLNFFRETPLFQYSLFAINKPGLIATERYVPIFRKFFPQDSFEALKIPLLVVATNLMSGTEKVFSKGPLIPTLLASAALPPVFSPVEIDGHFYADGGIMNNFPKEHLEKDSDFIIGSNVSITFPLEKKDLRNPIQLAQRVTSLMVHASNHEKLRTCDLFIEPMDLEKIGVLDKKGIEKAFTIGYDQASRAIELFLKAPPVGDQTSS